MVLILLILRAVLAVGGLVWLVGFLVSGTDHRRSRVQNTK